MTGMKVIERFKDFPEVGRDYVLGKLNNGKYYCAYGSKYPFSKDIPFRSKIDDTGGIVFYDNLESLVMTTIDDVGSYVYTHPAAKSEIDNILSLVKKYQAVFETGINVDLDNEEIMEARIAEITWGLTIGTIEKNMEKFPVGTIRKVGNKPFEAVLVTEQGMEFVFGPVYERNIS